MLSKTSPLQDSSQKGNFDDNSSILQDDGQMIKFQRCLGGPEQAKDTIELFQRLNEGDEDQKLMADGIISNLIYNHKVSKRTLATVLKIGSGRIKRNRDGKSKVTDHVHLNGNQVSIRDIENLKAFVDSLTVESVYPCSHRRMKLYVLEVGVDNFTRLHEKYLQQIGDNRVLPYPTFMKYMRSHHGNVEIVRAKEDCCDTCFRLSVAAQNADLGEEGRGLIEEPQRVLTNDDAVISGV